MSEVLAVEFDYGVDEVVALNLHVQRVGPAQRRQRVVFGVVASIVGGSSVWLLSDSYSFDMKLWLSAAVLIVLGITSLCGWLLFPRMIRGRVKNIVSQGRGRALFGLNRIELRDDMLLRSSAISEAWVKWAGIETIEYDAQYAYIAIGITGAYVVPRRAFSNDADYQRFIARAIELWQQGQRQQRVD